MMGEKPLSLLGEKPLSLLGEDDNLIPDRGDGRIGHGMDVLDLKMYCGVWRLALFWFCGCCREKLMDRIESDQCSALSP
jgi:hypothetical protein